MSSAFNAYGRTRAASLSIILLCAALLVACGVPQPIVVIDAIAFTSNRAGNADIYLVNVDDTGLIQLTNNSAADYQPDWSPDGQRIAFVSERDGNPEIYVMNADGSAQTRLTSDPGKDWNPAWSPDGAIIAFTSNREGNFDIYLMRLDGSQATRYTTGRPGRFWPSWSPDGQRLAYHSTTSEESSLCILDVEPLLQDTPRTSAICRGNGLSLDSNPAWSPDGELIAFQRSLEANTSIYLTSANAASAATPLTQGTTTDWFPAWSPDGSHLAYTSNVDGDLEIFIITSDGADPTSLASDPATDSYPAWRPRAGQR